MNDCEARPTVELMKLYRNLWEAMSANDECDVIDSKEYRRVTQEWFDAGFPTERLSLFIWRHANMRSDGTYPE